MYIIQLILFKEKPESKYVCFKANTSDTTFTDFDIILRYIIWFYLCL